MLPLQTRLRSLLLALCMVFLFGCQSTPWKLMRSVNPYLKKQPAQPYAHSVRMSGARFQIKKFYATPMLACAAFQIDNRKGYGEIYLRPSRAKLVCQKLGIWALTSTAASREPMFRRMAQDFYNIKDASQVPRWSRLYVPRRIPLRQVKQGLVCFQLMLRPKDPNGMKMNERCRIRFADMRLGTGKVRADWMHVEPMK